MYYINFVDYIILMKLLMVLTIPMILSMSIMLGLGSTNLGVFGQQENQTAQQANQTASQANQTAASQPSNQTAAQQQDPKMNEKLLNLTNNAISALNDNNDTGVADSLSQIQGTLINASQASGKQVVIVPSDVVSENADEESGSE
jgi:hypothetical protein